MSRNGLLPRLARDAMGGKLRGSSFPPAMPNHSRARIARVAVHLAALASATQFAIACSGDAITTPRSDTGKGTPPAPATIAVRVRLTGNGADADGFVIALGSRSGRASVDAPATFDNVSAGEVILRLSDLAPHCAAASDSVRLVAAPGSAVQAEFTVDCVGGFAWTRGDGALEYLREDGRVVVIAEGAGTNRFANAFSPDGKALVWSDYHVAAGRGRVAISRLDGSAPTVYTEPPAGWSDFEPAWSPDGQLVAFTRSTNAGTAHLMLMNADGSGVRVLVPGGWVGWPSWSPDGQELAVLSMQGGGLNLVVFRRDGTVARPLTQFKAPDGVGGTIWWAASGDAIGFMTFIGGRQGIHVAGSTGGPIVNLWPREGIAYNYDWAPDGNRVVLSVTPEPQIPGIATTRLFVVNRDASDPRELVPGLDAFGADWSPDGARILFSVARAGVARELMIVRPDVSGLRAVTDSSSHTAPLWNPVARPGSGR